MPTTLPSPVDRPNFRFLAIDSTGTAWEWVDSEMIWAPVAEPASPDGGPLRSNFTLH